MEDSHVDDVKKSTNAISIFTLFSNLLGEKNQNPKYCLELVKTLRGNEFAVGSKTNLEYSIKRIIRGLGSSRLHSQCGCFSALTCVLKSQACLVEDVLKALEKELEPNIGATKSEIGALNTACVLTCGAIIHSGLLMGLSAETQTNVLKKLIDSGKKKSYLATVSLKFVADAVNVLDKQRFKEVLWPICRADLLNNLDQCSVDAYYLLLVCLSKSPKPVTKFLEKNFSSVDLLVEKVIMCLLCNPVRFEHPINETVCEILCKDFPIKFWSNCIRDNVKNSQHRDNTFVTLLFYIFKHIQDVKIIPKLLTPQLIDIFIRVLSVKRNKNYKEADYSVIAKDALNVMVATLNEKTTPDEVRFEVIKKLFFYPANMKFEMRTGTKCIQSLVSNLSSDYTKQLSEIYKQIIMGELKKKSDENVEENWSSKEKQHAFYSFVKMFNHPSVKSEISWKLEQIKFIFDLGFLRKFQIVSEVKKCAKDCFYKAVMLRMPSLKDLVLLLDELASYVNDNMKDKNLKVTEDVICLWEKMFSVVHKLRKKSDNKLYIAVHVLLIYMGLQLFSDYELAKSGIEELLSCYAHLQVVHCRKKDLTGVEKGDAKEPHWTEVTVDLILSLLSRENKLWRHVVSCIFPQIVSHVTPTALHQVIEALDPKSENKVLKHINSDDSESEEEPEGEGEGEGGEESESSESEGSDVEDYEEGEEVKVNDQLRLAVRNALGYSAALTDDESVDMDQMDEEEEKRLNESLAEAFKLFKTKSQGKKKKQTKEEEALTHFRIRVLDLIEIYITNTPSMGGCLDLILPLLDVLEMSVKDHHQRPLQNRVDSILKHISVVKNFSNVENVTQTVIKDIFDAVIGRKEISALVFVEMSPRISDCTTFLVRCSQLLPKEDSDIPLVGEYNSLLKSFSQCRDFRLPISMFQAIMRMAWTGNFKIVGTLFEFLAATNVRIFKKMKIIELLRIFYKNDKLHSLCDKDFRSELIIAETRFIDNFVGFLSEYEDGNELKSSEKMYLSFFSNTIMLINLIHSCWKKHHQNAKKHSPWEKLISKMVTVDVINANKKTRSQLMNVANAFNVEMPAREAGKRRRSVSESSIHSNKNEDEKEEEEDKVKKKSKKKMSMEKMKLKKESRKMREEMSSTGLEEVRFSAVDFQSLPELENEEIDETEKPGKKRKSKEILPNGDVSADVKRKKKNSNK